MTQPTLKAVIYTPNKYAAAMGILVMQVEDEEVLAVIDVNKRVGSNAYEYKLDGAPSNGLSRMEAEDCWELAAENYGAVLVQVDKKFMKDNFKDILKPYQLLAKEQRKVERELKKTKSKTEQSGYHITR